MNALLHDAVDAVLKFFRENVIDIINGAYQPEIVGLSHFFEHILRAQDRDESFGQPIELDEIAGHTSDYLLLESDCQR